MDQLHLRPATTDDRLFIERLEEVCMRDYAIALWGGWRPDPDGFAPDRQRIIVFDGMDAGCVETEVRPDHVWLDKFYLLPSHQRRGIGAAVLHTLIGEAKSLALPLRLSVLTTNPAQAFYRREGLQELSRDAERIRFEARLFS